MQFLYIHSITLFSICMSQNVTKVYNERIVGGYECENTYPFMVSLRQSSRHICGGTLIHPSWIMTAAHCNLLPLVAVMGSNDVDSQSGVRIELDYIISSPYYELSQLSYDIALGRLRRDVFDIRPVQLPIGPYPIDVTEHCLTCQVMGWGITDELSPYIPSKLRCVTLQTIKLKVCERRYKIRLNGVICTLTPDKGACKGDSGGPLMCGYIQFGIVSWGQGCAHPKFPGVFTSVENNIKWIFMIVNAAERNNHVLGRTGLLLGILNFVLR